MSLGGGYMLPSRDGNAIAAIGLGITTKTDGKSTHDAYSLFECSIPPETSGHAEPEGAVLLSDFPMPRDYPEWPTGAQIRRHLEAYAAEFASTAGCGCAPT